MKAILATLAGLVIVAGVAIAWKWTGTTPPIRGDDGKPVAGSVAEFAMVPLNGLDQFVLIRGRDMTKPVLVVLHGGPGVTVMPLIRRYNEKLENSFVVVNWDQRGAGKTWSSATDPATLTTENMLRDLDALVDHLCRKLGARKVILAGHSWGSVLGVLYAKQHPDKVAAYIGIGQVSDRAESERRGYAWALSQAQARNDVVAIRELTEIGPPPYDWRKENVERKYVAKYGGSLVKPRSTFELLVDAVFISETSWFDLPGFLNGEELSLNALHGELTAVNFPRDVPSLEVPVAFFLGRNDHAVSAEVAAHYFEELDAPVKRLVWFEESAHSPFMEEPDAFNAAVAQAAKDFGL